MHPQPLNLTQTANTSGTKPKESKSLAEIEDAISTPNSTQPLSGTTYDASKAEDLRMFFFNLFKHPYLYLTMKSYAGKARKVAVNALSTSYKLYMPPKLSDQRDKHGRRMIRYCCRL